MANVLDIEFYRFGPGQSVGDVLKTIYLPKDAFADETAWQEWATKNLQGERSQQNRLWAEGVRAVDETGAQVFNWTWWDRIGGQPLRPADQTDRR